MYYSGHIIACYLNGPLIDFYKVNDGGHEEPLFDAPAGNCKKARLSRAVMAERRHASVINVVLPNHVQAVRVLAAGHPKDNLVVNTEDIEHVMLYIQEHGINEMDSQPEQGIDQIDSQSEGKKVWKMGGGRRATKNEDGSWTYLR